MPAHEIDSVSLFIGFNAGIFAMQAAAHCGARIFFFHQRETSHWIVL